MFTELRGTRLREGGRVFIEERRVCVEEGRILMKERRFRMEEARVCMREERSPRRAKQHAAGSWLLRWLVKGRFTTFVLLHAGCARAATQQGTETAAASKSAHPSTFRCAARQHQDNKPTVPALFEELRRRLLSPTRRLCQGQYRRCRRKCCCSQADDALAARC
jgi:hypothetical protein